MTVLIAGGGIGGLTLALSLHQVGVECRVFESVPALKPLGVGINVLPHAVRELFELGLKEKLESVGVLTKDLCYFSKHGKPIISEPRGLEAGYRWPQFSINRGKLQQLLLDAVIERMGAECVLTGHHISSWSDTPNGVRAEFINKASGEVVGAYEGALLVGADGIHSGVRQGLYPEEGPPLWTGRIMWRGVTLAEPFLSGRSVLMAGYQAQKFLCYPISNVPDENGKYEINWVAARQLPETYDWHQQDWNRAGSLEDYLPWFKEWDFGWLDIPGLMRNCSRSYEFPLVDRDPLPRWSFGSVTLLGDAAHPMYPIGSNGASQAILDARTLTREILEHGETPSALHAYEAERRPATAEIVKLNRRNGPEHVMQIVEERAPNGFDVVTDVISQSELEEIGANYRRVAGFQVEELNARPPIVSLPKSRAG
ncbi:flavin-dependent oxidoreductase [Bradyrhizobium vignae]|uniref:FAD-binding domain-containing protein n=1 Tax=Bradyrhizobium vignae TaxID=1549949 RepID=A0A2U3PUV0_9BRAD|nr:flavin-dependent oxidoreductase [Bradyrhizobium vignae]SPP92922.1 conserved protein of unknown function [Bradyrhizobium vignae]